MVLNEFGLDALDVGQRPCLRQRLDRIQGGVDVRRHVACDLITEGLRRIGLNSGSIVEA